MNNQLFLILNRQHINDNDEKIYKYHLFVLYKKFRFSLYFCYNFSIHTYRTFDKCNLNIYFSFFYHNLLVLLSHLHT